MGRELKNEVLEGKAPSLLSLASKEENWYEIRSSSRCRKMKRGWRNSEEWAQRIILVVAF